MSTQSEDFLESLERTHVVLFHDGTEEKKQTEYGFIKKGLDKGQHCFYTTPVSYTHLTLPTSNSV